MLQRTTSGIHQVNEPYNRKTREATHPWGARMARNRAPNGRKCGVDWVSVKWRADDGPFDESCPQSPDPSKEVSRNESLSFSTRGLLPFSMTNHSQRVTTTYT